MTEAEFVAEQARLVATAEWRKKVDAALALRDDKRGLHARVTRELENAEFALKKLLSEEPTA